MSPAPIADEAALSIAVDPVIHATTWVDGGTGTIQRRIAYPPTAPNSRGTPLTQANVASLELWSYNVTNTDSPSPISGFDGLDLSVANCITNTLQPWSVDDLGYNFNYTMNTSFTGGAEVVSVTVRYVTNDTPPITGMLIWQGPVGPTYT